MWAFGKAFLRALALPVGRRGLAGFSLIELMVVIGIISILTSMVKHKSKQLKCKAIDSYALGCMKAVRTKYASEEDPGSMATVDMNCGKSITDRCLNRDVNMDGLVTSDDADALINLITAGVSEENMDPKYIYDLSGDGRVSPQDVLQVINCLLIPTCPKSLDEVL